MIDFYQNHGLISLTNVLIDQSHSCKHGVWAILWGCSILFWILPQMFRSPVIWCYRYSFVNNTLSETLIWSSVLFKHVLSWSFQRWWYNNRSASKLIILKILSYLLFSGKCFFTSLMNSLPLFIFTFWLYDRLNLTAFLLLFLWVFWVLPLSKGINEKPPTLFRASSWQIYFCRTIYGNSFCCDVL